MSFMVGNFIAYGIRHKNVLIKAYTGVLILWAILIGILSISDILESGDIFVNIIILIIFVLPPSAPLMYLESRNRGTIVSTSVEVREEPEKKEEPKKEEKLIPEKELENKCPNCAGVLIETKEKGFLGEKLKISCRSCGTSWKNSEKLAREIIAAEAKAAREAELAAAQESKQLPVLDSGQTRMIMKKDELLHLVINTTLIEERKQREYIAGHSGVRVAKGVFIGGTKGRAESKGVLRTVDEGQLALTNKRLIFNGDKYNRNFDLRKLVTIERYEDAIEIAVENRQKVQIFTVNDPEKWEVFIRVAAENAS